MSNSFFLLLSLHGLLLLIEPPPWLHGSRNDMVAAQAEETEDDELKKTSFHLKQGSRIFNIQASALFG